MNLNLSVALTIARKDVVDAVRNYYILFCIVMPVGFWLLFHFIFPSNTDNIKLDAMAVYDQGASRLVELLRPAVEGIVEVRSMEDLTSALRKDATVGLVLPAELDAGIAADKSPEVTLLVGAAGKGKDTSSYHRLVTSQLQVLSNRAPVARIVQRSVDAPVSSPTPEAGAATTGEEQSKQSSQSFDMQGYLLGLMLAMALSMVGAFVVPTLLVEEKEKNTLKALLVSPASYIDVLVGKALVGMFYSLVVSGLLLGLNGGLGNNVVLLAAAVVLGSALLVEAGLLMGALFRATTQVNTWSSFVMLFAMAPSWLGAGFAPKSVETVMRFVPTYYLHDLVKAAMGDTATMGIWTSMAILAGSVAALFVANVYVLRRSEG